MYNICIYHNIVVSLNLHTKNVSSKLCYTVLTLIILLIRLARELFTLLLDNDTAGCSASMLRSLLWLARCWWSIDNPMSDWINTCPVLFFLRIKYYNINLKNNLFMQILVI